VAEEKRFYGGQAVLEGIMMRGRDVYATAVRRLDNTVAVESRPIPHFLEGWKVAKWPLVRGTFMLVETLTLGLRSLQFSGNIAIQDEMDAAAASADDAPPEEPRRPWLFAGIVALLGAVAVWFGGGWLAPQVAKLPWFDTAADGLLPARILVGAVVVLVLYGLLKPPKEQGGPESLSDTAMWLAMIPAFGFGIFLFVLLPSLITGWVKIEGGVGVDILKNLIEGVVRLGAILGYIAAISLIPQIKRVFQYHGAEHQTINALEKHGHVTLENATADSPLHPRCGTAFLLLFILLKIIIGCFFGWPTWWLRLLLRLAMVPVVAAMAYETVRLAGRYRDSLFAKILSGPGLLMQRMTTRAPEPAMVEVAMYALAAVAPEVSLPDDWPPPTTFTPGQPEEADEPVAVESEEDDP